VDISWVDRGLVIVRSGDKTLHVGGEALLEGHPDFLIYARYINHWEDGTSISDEEKADVLDRLVEEAVKRGWKFEIEW
jgi:Immunity protein 74